MSLNRYNPKRDANEKLIVDALRAYGASVERLNTPVDLLVGYRGQTHLVEVKIEGAKLNKAQVEFRDSWKGSPMQVLRSVEDVAEFMKGLRHEE